MQLATQKKWSAIVKEQQLSQLSVTQFCRQQNISPSVFYQRKRQLTNQCHSQSTFIKAVVTEQLEIQQVSEPLILTVGQTRLSLPSQTSPEYLSQLIKGINT